jgi:2,3-bisphosphoglycerate-dependent phosphoglycerate mutase
MTVERVLLIRHGETEWNMLGRWQGYEQTSLNELGMEQAIALANYLRHRPIAAIYSSDLLRALQTATAVGEAVGVEPESYSDWREHHLGIFQGLTRDEIQTKYPTEWGRLRTEYWEYIIPNGESRADTQRRAYRAWEMCLEDAKGSEIMIVSHGGTIKMLLMKLFGEEPRVVDAYLPNTSITTIERSEQGWRLLEIGATPHLSNVNGRAVEGT